MTTVTEEQLRQKIQTNWRVSGPRRLPNGWDSWCQSLMHNVAEFAQHIPDGVSHPSAMDAYRASRIESKDASKAPAGAAHFWAEPDPYGHVAYDMDGGGTRLLMASSYVTDEWALNAGTISFADYQARRGNPYLGWSRTDGMFKLPVLAGRTSSTPAQKSAKSVLESNGLTNVDALIAGSKRTGVPLWIAAAVLEKETGGANIFGHDSGGAMYGAGEVTEAKFREFQRIFKTTDAASNGVGPMQITYFPFFADMESKGLKPWVPADNIFYGLTLMAEYLGGDFSDASIRRAGVRYNGADAYGDHLVTVAHKWRDRLANTTTEGELSMADINSITKQLTDIRDQFRNLQAAPFLQIRNKADGKVYVWNPHTGQIWHLPNTSYLNLWKGYGLLSDDVIDVPQNVFDHFTEFSGRLGDDEVHKRLETVEGKLDALIERLEK